MIHAGKGQWQTEFLSQRFPFSFCGSVTVLGLFGFFCFPSITVSFSFSPPKKAVKWIFLQRKRVGRCLTQFPIFVFNHGKHVVSKLFYIVQLMVPTTCCVTCTVCSSVEHGPWLWASSPFIHRLASLGTQHPLCVSARVSVWYPDWDLLSSR